MKTASTDDKLCWFGPQLSLLPILLISGVLINHCTHASTEWFGDLRAHSDQNTQSPFYDITYDDVVCSEGIESEAIPNYAYFGQLLKSVGVTGHAECLDYCIKTTNCIAVNYFRSLKFRGKKHFCELLRETQLSNPRLMRPFKHAVYFESIRCRNNFFDIPDTVIDSFSQPKLDLSSILNGVSPKNVDQMYSIKHQHRQKSNTNLQNFRS